MPFCNVCDITVLKLARHKRTGKHRKNCIKKTNLSKNAPFKKTKLQPSSLSINQINESKSSATFNYANFTIITLNYRENVKFKCTEADYKIEFQADHFELEAYERLLGHLLEDRLSVKAGDRYKISLSHPELHTKSISTPIATFQRGASLDFTKFEGLANHKYESLDLRDATVHFKVLGMPHGEKGTVILNILDQMQSKRCIIQIVNQDTLCLPRAIIVALSCLVEENAHVRAIFTENLAVENILEKAKYLKDSRKPLQGNLEAVRVIEESLKVQINIVCTETLNKVIYSGPSCETMLYLLKVANHYHVITSMAALYGASYYCHEHKARFESACPTCKREKTCRVCAQTHTNKAIEKHSCNSCKRTFLNGECFDNHKRSVSQRASICASTWKCTLCGQSFQTGKESPSIHKCGHFKCPNCTLYVEEKSHQCFMQRKPFKGLLPEGELSERIIVFDFECYTDEAGVHIVNHANAQYLYDSTVRTFDCNADFCSWLISPIHRGYTAFAHNARGYDAHFILKYCIENTIVPKTIYTGSKILLLEVPQIRLKVQDSMSLIPGALSAFPRTFGLTELAKGYFPHAFNKPANWLYSGAPPPVEAYECNSMKGDERERFLRWHTEKMVQYETGEYVFNLMDELREYCHSDVTILKEGLRKFRDDFYSICGIDPLQYLTIASVCLAIYQKDVPLNSIAILKADSRDVASQKAIVWLEYVADREKIVIQHAENGGEAVLLGTKVDGYNVSTRTVYQFYGCFWHGCPQCYTSIRYNSKCKQSMESLYKRTLTFASRLRRCHYTLVELWECQFTKLSKESSFQLFKRKWDLKGSLSIGPLRPRDAFFGGRTNASKLYYKCTGDTVIRYVDFVSLYPTVMYYDAYPLGHPVILKSPDRYDPSWFGLIKCKVSPPYSLYHPVLPVRIKTANAEEKLFFPLCRLCAVNQITDACFHSQDERCLTGTWCSNELAKALGKGYTIVELYEVHHFPGSSTELFKDYIKCFMRIKQESSGLPVGVSKEQFIEENRTQLGIELAGEQIEKNAGRRAVAKLCLNSLWGKFGQRQNLSKTEYIHQLDALYRLVLNEKVEILNFTAVTPNIMELSYQFKDEFTRDSSNTNEYIAAFTTASARLRLYALLETLGETVCYYDTDSVLYIDNGAKTVQTGNLLGQLTLEDTLLEFVSTGPKSYSYQTVEGACTTKVKGFTLNFATSQSISHESMRRMVLGEGPASITTEGSIITRSQTAKEIITVQQKKILQFNYNKRIVKATNGECIDTIPFGYQRGLIEGSI